MPSLETAGEAPSGERGRQTSSHDGRGDQLRHRIPGAEPAVPVGHPRVGIVILNWKRPDHTRACLRSVERLLYPCLDVVVVDNGWQDGHPGVIRDEFPWVTVLENGRNLGFAGGCNVGIDHVLRGGANYVFLLNDDAEVSPELLDVLVDAGERQPDVGILGPTICYFDRPEVVWFAGGRVDAIGEPSHLGDGELHDGSTPGMTDVDYVTGCAMLVKRVVLESVGALDERFFAYFEETEWSARARRAGFRVVHVPRARMWHKIEMSARTTSRLYLYLMTRNRLLYLRCAGAGVPTILRAIVDLVRTLLSWRIRPDHSQMRPYSGVLVRGIADFLLGRFGPPPVRL